MGEFVAMLREALIETAPQVPDPDVAALDRSVQRFRRRMRVVRVLSAVMVLGTSVVMFAGLALLLTAGDDTSARESMLYGCLFVWGGCGVAFGKAWFSAMQNHLQLMAELKLTQLRVMTAGAGLR